MGELNASALTRYGLARKADKKIIVKRFEAGNENLIKTHQG